jgi:SAM-dependent methyltransferase
MAELSTRQRRALLEATYDRRMGVQTSRLVAVTDLGIDPSKLGEVIAYVPSPAWALPVILKQLNIRYADYNFIDLGSGMGRVVLMAAEFPFARVVGVELSQQLHEIAKDNLARSSRRLRAGSVELICQYAQEYAFPCGNCVIYLYNPFRETVMQTVLKNLERCYAKGTAELYVIYLNPVLETILDAAPFLRRIKMTREYSIHHSVSPTSSAHAAR